MAAFYCEKNLLEFSRREIGQRTDGSGDTRHENATTRHDWEVLLIEGQRNLMEESHSFHANVVQE